MAKKAETGKITKQINCNPTLYIYKRHGLDPKTQIGESKNMENMYHSHSCSKRAWMAMLILDKIGFKKKIVIIGKEEHLQWLRDQSIKQVKQL